MTTTRYPRIVVAGFTEAGKTSLIKTLLQDPFTGSPVDANGEQVNQRIPTNTLETRRYPVTLDGVTIAEISDTPGFRRIEDLLGATRDKLTALNAPRPEQRRQVVLEEVRRLRDEELATGNYVSGESAAYVHEDQALEAAFEADVVLYVVDASVPPGGDDRALAALLYEMRLPVVGVQNRAVPSSARGDYRDDWKHMLLEFGVARIEVLDAWLPADDSVPDLMGAMRSVVDPDRRQAFDRRTRWHAERLATALAESSQACAAALRAIVRLEVVSQSRRSATKAEIEAANEKARTKLEDQVRALVIDALRTVWSKHGFPIEQFTSRVALDTTRLVGLGDGVIEFVRGTLDAMAGWFTGKSTDYHRVDAPWIQQMALKFVHAIRRIRSFGHANPMVVDVSEPAALPRDAARQLEEAVAVGDWTEMPTILALCAHGGADSANGAALRS
jgi:predicted GTPase